MDLGAEHEMDHSGMLSKPVARQLELKDPSVTELGANRVATGSGLALDLHCESNDVAAAAEENSDA